MNELDSESICNGSHIVLDQLKNGDTVNDRGESPYHLTNVCSSCGQKVVRPYQPVERAETTKDITKEIREKVSKRLYGAWSEVDFHVEQISGGLSNYLYICTLPDNVETTENEPKKLLVRIYGQCLVDNNNSVVIDSILFAILSEKKIGPKLYGVFPGGRIEEYIESRPLKTQELSLPSVSTEIARQFKILHELDMPLNKKPIFTYKLLSKWIGLLDKIEDEQTKDIVARHNVSNEISWVIDLFTHKLKNFSPVVFCHNDLQENNILLLNNLASDKNAQLQMIDFEYSGYNFRCFDLGNHFMEWCFDYIVEEWPHFVYTAEAFPTIEQQLNFWHVYKSSGDDTTEEHFLKEVHYGAMYANLLWAVWSLVQNNLSKCHFGFLEHAECRMKVYKKLKDSLPESEVIPA